MPPKAKAKAAPAEPVEPDIRPIDEPTPLDSEADTDGDQTPAPVDEPAGDEDDGADTTSDSEADTGMVDEPCHKHFPDGWPVHEEGAYVNCPHAFGIRYGDQIEITRERAVQLGFLTGEE